MAWTERQQALLQAMGLRVWSAPSMAGEAADVEVASPAAPLAPTVPIAPPVLPSASRHAPSGLPAQAREAVAPSAPAPDRGRGVAQTAPGQPATGGRDDVSEMDWLQLRQAVADCRACGLCQGRTQTVFGTGHERAHWLVVGEAPGEAEDQQGEPFVGAAGQLLDRMLAALQLSRLPDGPPAQRVYIANTLKCRPPRNRNPSADELAHCEPFLKRQIALLQPRIILAMGRFAVQTLLRSDAPIGRLRGQVHRYQGVPLVVTYHPAYLLRSLTEKAKAWEDLCLAADTAEQAAGSP